MTPTEEMLERFLRAHCGISPRQSHGEFYFGVCNLDGGSRMQVRVPESPTVCIVSLSELARRIDARRS